MLLSKSRLKTPQQSPPRQISGAQSAGPLVRRRETVQQLTDDHRGDCQGEVRWHRAWT